jgi:hypothetical protein
MLSNAHMTDALSMAPPDQVLASAGHTAFGTLPAVFADGCKHDGVCKPQLDMQTDAVTFSSCVSQFPWCGGSQQIPTSFAMDEELVCFVTVSSNVTLSVRQVVTHTIFKTCCQLGILVLCSLYDSSVTRVVWPH